VSRDDRVCVGVIAGAHGVRGDVRVRSFTAVPEDIAGLGPLSDEGGERQFRLRLVGRTKDALRARIDGVADRTAAEALKGTRLYVARAVLPEPAEDEFYHADLIGLRVELEDGSEIGRVKAVHDFGAGDVIEVTPLERGSDWARAMLPFTAEAVPVVDLEGGRIVVAPPPGLFAGGEDEEKGGEER
jgi:16S rRNA processing protein RimM